MDQSLTHKIKQHKAISPFNYDMTVDWAIDLMKDGVEIDSVLMLASFSKPVDSEEIKPYVSAVFKDLGIDEDEAIRNPISYLGFYVEKVANKEDLRDNLVELFYLCIHYDHWYGLSPFYMLQCAWEDLESMEFSPSYDGATMDNIERLAITEARKWLKENLSK